MIQARSRRTRHAPKWVSNVRHLLDISRDATREEGMDDETSRVPKHSVKCTQTAHFLGAADSQRGGSGALGQGAQRRQKQTRDGARAHWWKRSRAQQRRETAAAVDSTRPTRATERTRPDSAATGRMAPLRTSPPTRSRYPEPQLSRLSLPL